MSELQPDPFSPEMADYAADDPLDAQLENSVAIAYARSVRSMAGELASAIRQRLQIRGEGSPHNLDDTVCAFFVSDMSNSLKEEELHPPDVTDSEGSIELRALGCRILIRQLNERLVGQEDALAATMELIGDDLTSLIQEPGLMERLSTNAIRKLPRIDADSTFHPTPQIPGGH